ncbi:ferrochelatase [Siculibacillus lacustris]|uniref:Ferrochelatase n=1 Tax=Siculibacillus lacustris TaxID=1549641 RepID=A0A4Q9VWY6_9HYPH|nr:ferrochelatase [Siculibacillus lacustris]TBW40753.1 ferrochelatase [Siculibacillus lacustris]
MTPSETAARAARPAGHPEVATGRIGVLIVNLGTPEATDYWSMRRYLREFLSDRRVVDVPRLIWWPLLNLVILTTRPGRKGRDYDTIWNHELGEGPLKTITRSQAAHLGERLAGLSDRIVVDWAMRYGRPTIADRIAALLAQGCERILLVPLYPQYAAATSATVADAAFDALKAMRRQPALRVAPPWYDDPTYIDRLAADLTAAIAAADHEPEVILASFHGIPKRFLDAGDPYFCHCAKTVRLLREATGLGDRLRMTFQSRFGREPWLQPYTDETIVALARSGVRRLMVIAPGFVADCLETLEELGHENRAAFLAAGGEDFQLVPCFNDSPRGLDVLEAVVTRELAGWV